MSSPEDQFHDFRDAQALSDDEDREIEEDFLDALDKEVQELEDAGCGTFQTGKTVKDFEREVREGVEQFEKVKEETKEDTIEEKLQKIDLEEEEMEEKFKNEEETKEKEKKELEERIKKEDAMTEDERKALLAEANALKKEGNDFYLKSENDSAVKKYTEAFEKCPLCFKEERAVFMANRAAAKITMGLKEGALEDCNASAELNPNYVKVLARRGQLQEDMNKPHEAQKDFEKVLQLDKDHKEARKAMQRLPAKIAQRDEEIKAEMFDNLKKLGNMVLNPFGLSTNNFNFVQNPENGGYSVNFNQNGGSS